MTGSHKQKGTLTVAQLNYGTFRTNCCFFVSILVATNITAVGRIQKCKEIYTESICVFQNSPEVDDEGYSIRPDEESEEGDILSTA